MTIHEDIQNAIKNCNLVFFIGSGFSIPLGLPNWNGLVNNIVASLKKSYPDNKFINDAPLMIEQGTFSALEVLDKLQKSNSTRVFNIVKESIDIELKDSNLNRHRKLWQITDQIVTTNYDRSFELAATNRITKIVYEDKFHISKISRSDNFLFKVHGCIERPGECILFTEQYEKLYSEKSGSIIELFKILTDKVIIFIGFSLQDPYFNKLLDLRKEVYGNFFQNHFIITTEKKDFSSYGIERINEVNNYGEDLDNFLDRLSLIRDSNPCGLGVLMNELRKQKKEFNEEIVRKKFFDFIFSLEKNPETVAIVDEIKAGDFENAEEKLKSELDKDLIQIKENRESAAEKAFELAKLYQLQLRYKDAVQYYEQAVELKPKNSIFISELGYQINILGNHKKAIEYYEMALAIDLNVHGDQHPNVATGFNNIGSAWGMLGESKKAIEFFERALTIDLNLHGDQHPNVAIDFNNIGTAWDNLGESKKAIEYFEKALAIDLNVHGDQHPKVSIRYNNIGTAWNSLGNPKKAIEFFEKALAIDLNVHGDQHPKVSIRYNNIGLAWHKLGESKKAIEYYEKAIAIDLNVYGDKHPNIATRYNNIGLAWYSLGDSKKAIEYYEKSIAIDMDVYGDKHPNVAINFNNMGLAWNKLGESKKAIEYYERAIAIDMDAYGDEHPNIATRYNNMGAAWYKLGESKKAIGYYEKALAINLNVYGDEHPNVATEYSNIGLAWVNLGDSKKAINYFEKALKIFIDRLGEKHPNTLSVMQNLNHMNKQK